MEPLAMSGEYVTAQDDMIDAIAWGYYGYAAGAVEAILALNPGLSLQPPMLPENITIVLPDIAAAPSPPKQTINIWD
jgi:phage tail protein X